MPLYRLLSARSAARDASTRTNRGYAVLYHTLLHPLTYVYVLSEAYNSKHQG